MMVYILKSLVKISLAWIFFLNISYADIIIDEQEVDSIKIKYFLDYDGEIKSLGAWGGDFILAAGPENSKDYFFDKGFKTVFNFNTIF